MQTSTFKTNLDTNRVNKKNSSNSKETLDKNGCDTWFDENNLIPGLAAYIIKNYNIRCTPINNKCRVEDNVDINQETISAYKDLSRLEGDDGKLIAVFCDRKNSKLVNLNFGNITIPFASPNCTIKVNLVKRKKVVTPIITNVNSPIITNVDSPIISLESNNFEAVTHTTFRNRNDRKRTELSSKIITNVSDSNLNNNLLVGSSNNSGVSATSISIIEQMDITDSTISDSDHSANDEIINMVISQLRQCLTEIPNKSDIEAANSLLKLIEGRVPYNALDMGIKSISANLDFTLSLMNSESQSKYNFCIISTLNFNINTLEDISKIYCAAAFTKEPYIINIIPNRDIDVKNNEILVNIFHPNANWVIK